jgi:hypothetical protein
VAGGHSQQLLITFITQWDFLDYNKIKRILNGTTRCRRVAAQGCIRQRLIARRRA